jgi:multidrug resistance efflux pump
MAAHETIMSREDKKNRRLIWVVVLLIVALVATNIAWLVTWNSYDFVTETEEVNQDGAGINIYGDENEVTQHGTENNETP